MKELYEKNKDFREYVNRYCGKHNVTVEVAITHKIVQEVGKMYRKENEHDI